MYVIGPIMEDSKVLQNLIIEATSSHIRRHGNEVAHRFAGLTFGLANDCI